METSLAYQIGYSEAGDAIKNRKPKIPVMPNRKAKETWGPISWGEYCKGWAQRLKEQKEIDTKW